RPNGTVGEIGNKRVRGHGLHMSMTIESPVRVLNPHAPLVQAAQLQRPEVHVPDPVVDFLQPDVLADADDRHVYPATIPPDPPVALTYRTSKRSGYSSRGMRPGIGTFAGRHQDA